jgi:2-dehydro-3-deoxyphosphogluconate aldolase/(4S)-4-hydroxy-2-oxoglutarate aldolase
MTTTTDRVPLPAGITATRVLAILRRSTPDEALRRVELLAGAGIAAVELTLDSPRATTTLAALRERHPGLHIGAGTALTADDLRRAHDAGAQFALSPHTDPRLVALAAGLGLAYLPGAATASEALTAWDAGATAVKLFPAEPGGAALLAALRQPLPHIPFVSTGGITPANAAAHLAAGAAAVSLGGALTGLPPTEMAITARRVLTAAAEAGPWR